MISRTNFTIIASHCNNQYPEEACGIVYKNGDVTCLINIQNQLHKLCPITYQRMANNAYAISQEDIQKIERSFITGNPVITVFHSHPGAGAYFSQEGKDKALYLGVVANQLNERPRKTMRFRTPKEMIERCVALTN